MPSLWSQLSVATEDCISPQPSKSSYAIWTTFIQSGPSAKKIACVILSLLFCVIWLAVCLLIGRNEAATDYWQDGYFILPDSFASSLDTRATARSPRSSTHSLTSLTHAYAHCHSRAHTYATRNTMPRYCDVHVFPHLLKVRLLNMLHSIRPDYVII